MRFHDIVYPAAAAALWLLASPNDWTRGAVLWGVCLTCYVVGRLVSTKHL